jgi:hypothetical protein
MGQREDDKRYRVRRKYIRSFQTNLTPLERRAVRELFALYGGGPIRPLVDWIAALREGLKLYDPTAFNRAGRQNVIKDDEWPHKALVADWRKAFLHEENGKSYSQEGLIFVIRKIRITGIPKKGPAWTGEMLLIFERNTNSLFHFIGARGIKTEFPPSILWFALGKAWHYLEGKFQGLHTGFPDTEYPITLLTPSGSMDKTSQDFFNEAVAIYADAKVNGQQLVGASRLKTGLPLNPEQWNIGRYKSLSEINLRVGLKNAKELRGAFELLAKDVSKQILLRSIETKNGAGIRIDRIPRWTPLHKSGA